MCTQTHARTTHTRARIHIVTWAARIGGDEVLPDGVSTATAAARRTGFFPVR
jgi:hypothetical protein